MTMPDPAAFLPAWALTGATVSAPILRENTVWRVEAAEGTFALRFHRPGYRSDAMLASELDWMAALASAGLTVPTPRPTRSGPLIAVMPEGRASLLTWLPGTRMGKTGAPLALPDPEATFASLGATMARLHVASDAWVVPPGFTRPAWDEAGLIGDAPLWGRFWEAGFLSPSERDLFKTLRDEAAKALAALTPRADYGLIHADMVRENVLLNTDLPPTAPPGLIDFDDGGFGHRLFDVVTALGKNRGDDAFPALQSAFLSGYRGIRALDTSALPLFLALRAATYLGWTAARMDEPGAQIRAERNIAEAEAAARAFLGG